MTDTFRPDPKPSAARYQKYLKFLRTLLCVKTRRRGIESDPIIAAHQRQLNGGGTALKPSDFHALPQLNSSHQAEHREGRALLPHEAAHNCLLHEILYLSTNASVNHMVKIIDLIGDYIKENKI